MPKPTIPALMRRIGRHIVVDDETNCWRFSGSHTSRGYGRIAGRQPHTVVSAYLRGPTPPGHQIHHVCGTRDCVNPWHFRVVTPAQHRQAHADVQTHCRHGHEFTAENTYRHRGRRQCRACNRQAVARYAERKKASQA